MSRYQGMVLSGRAYTANSLQTQSFTLGTSLSTTTDVLAIYNPIGSGVNIVLWKAGCTIATIVTTAMLGEIVLAANTDTTKGAPSGGTSVTPTHNFLGNVMGFASKATVLAAVGSSVTLTASPTALRSLYGITGPTTIGGGSTTIPAEIDLGGDFVLAPGSCASLNVLGAGQGTFRASLSWAEIPLA